MTETVNRIQQNSTNNILGFSNFSRESRRYPGYLNISNNYRNRSSMNIDISRSPEMNRLSSHGKILGFQVPVMLTPGELLTESQREEEYSN